MKGLFKLIIGLVVFIVFSLIVLLVVGIILVNMTPNKLKVGNKTIINGKSCNDLGIGDVKIKTMINDFNEIKDKKNVVINPYDEAAAKSEITPILDTLGYVNDGVIDYQKLYEEGIDASAEYYIEFSDKSVAYILNNSISYFTGEAETLTNFKFEISEVTFYGNKKELRAVYKLDISDFKKKLEKTIPSFVSRFIGMPKEVYFVCYYGVDVTTEGVLDLEYKNIYINDVDTPFANAILLAFSTEENDLAGYGDQLGKALSDAVSYLGKIGVAEVDSSNHIISGTEQYGVSGYKDGKIGLICGN